MKLTKLFEMQRLLDESIYKEKGLRGKDLLEEKVLALRVELAELANIWRLFKYWSTKPSGPMEKILEELVDCIHFALSLAIDTDFEKEDIEFTSYIQCIKITEQFNACFNILTIVEESDFDDEEMKYFINNLLGLAELLEFTYDDIEAAYIKKIK